MRAFASLALVLTATSCAKEQTASADTYLSGAAVVGETIFNGSGCASCHGVEGAGGVGPALQGLPGSDVELADGSVIEADDAYLVESITDPAAQTVAGFTIAMPVNVLDQDEVQSIVAYLKEIG